MTRHFVAVLFALVIGHWTLIIGRDDVPPLARQVTIYRDTYWLNFCVLSIGAKLFPSPVVYPPRCAP
jgi:hypothetical protein